MTATKGGHHRMLKSGSGLDWPWALPIATNGFRWNERDDVIARIHTDRRLQILIQVNTECDQCHKVAELCNECIKSRGKP